MSAPERGGEPGFQGRLATPKQWLYSMVTWRNIKVQVIINDWNLQDNNHPSRTMQEFDLHCRLLWKFDKEYGPEHQPILWPLWKGIIQTCHSGNSVIPCTFISPSHCLIWFSLCTSSFTHTQIGTINWSQDSAPHPPRTKILIFTQSQNIPLFILPLHLRYLGTSSTVLTPLDQATCHCFFNLLFLPSLQSWSPFSSPSTAQKEPRSLPFQLPHPTFWGHYDPNNTTIGFFNSPRDGI